MRKNLSKLIVLGVLLLLTPITFMLRRWRQPLEYYQWQNTPGENIPLPVEVSGQRGSEVCASSDGQTVVVAGIRVIPQDIFEGKKSEPALILLCYKYFIYKSNTFGRDFECVYRSPSPGVVASMALSPANPHQLAFIAAEFQTTVPETTGEMAQMARDSKKRAELANEYALALQAKDLRIALYILDIEKKEPPRMLCTLDNYPLKFEGRSKDDLSQYSQYQLKLLNDMQSFKDAGWYAHWKLRLRLEKEAKNITWTSNGDAILVTTDIRSIIKIDLSGNKSPFYIRDPEEMLLISNLYCCVNGDVLFMEFIRKEEQVYLVRLDKNGNVLSKTRGALTFNGTLPFDEAVFVLVGKHKIATTDNKPSMHDAYLRTSALSPNIDDWKETVDWKDYSKTYDIHDPNRVQFFYMPKAFINNEKEILLFKRRVCHIYKPSEHPNWEVTPYKPENAAAPWVELRKMKIG